MAGAEHRNFDHADETKTFPNSRVDFLKIGGEVVRRFTLQPGWRWSKDAGPIAETDWCEAQHFQYQLSGQLHVLMADGSQLDFVAGEVSFLPRGHDSWVVPGEGPVTRGVEDRQICVASKEQIGSAARVKSAGHHLSWGLWKGDGGDRPRPEVPGSVTEVNLQLVRHVRHMGPFEENAAPFEHLFGRLAAWAGPRGLLDDPSSRLLSVHYDNPDITE